MQRKAHVDLLSVVGALVHGHEVEASHHLGTFVSFVELNNDEPRRVYQDLSQTAEIRKDVEQVLHLSLVGYHLFGVEEVHSPYYLSLFVDECNTTIARGLSVLLKRN